MSSKIFNSIKMRLFLALSILSSSVIILIFIFTFKDLGSNQVETLKDNIKILVELAEQNVSKSIIYNDNEELFTQLDAITANESIEYLALKSVRNNYYYQYHFEKALSNDFENSNFDKIQSEDKIIKYNHELSYKSKTIGTLYLGYNLKSFYARVDDLKSKKIKAFVYIFISSLVLMFIIVSIFISPITNIIKNLKKLRSESYLNKMNIKRNDELGYIYKTVDVLIDWIYDLKKSNPGNEHFDVKDHDKNQELLNSEEGFNSLYENANIGVYRISLKGLIVLANPALLKMLGYRTIEEFILNKESEDLLKRANFLKEVNKDGFAKGYEQTWKKKDNTEIIICESARAVKNKIGKILYYDITVEDITPLSRKNEISENTSKENSSNINTELLSQMSAEISNPLNNLINYTQLLEDEVYDYLPKDLQMSFEKIRNGSEKIARTMMPILNFDVNDSKIYKHQKEEINIVDDILQDLFNEFSLIAKRKSIDLNLNNFTEKSEISANLHTINQLFAILIENSLKYTYQGYININVFNDGDGILSITIEDTGIGIPEEKISKIFELNEQESANNVNNKKRGLLLVKKYCEINNATIKIVSKNSSGTKITVKFPEPFELANHKETKSIKKLQKTL